MVRLILLLLSEERVNILWFNPQGEGSGEPAPELVRVGGVGGVGGREEEGREAAHCRREGRRIKEGEAEKGWKGMKRISVCIIRSGNFLVVKIK